MWLFVWSCSGIVTQKAKHNDSVGILMVSSFLDYCFISAIKTCYNLEAKNGQVILNEGMKELSILDNGNIGHVWWQTRVEKVEASCVILGSQGQFTYANSTAYIQIPFNVALNLIKAHSLVSLSAPRKPHGAPVAAGIKQRTESWDLARTIAAVR